MPTHTMENSRRFWSQCVNTAYALSHLARISDTLSSLVNKSLYVSANALKTKRQQNKNPKKF